MLRFDSRALCEALDAQRVARSLAGADVARETGVAGATLRNILKGGRLEVDGMLNIVHWLGRSVESFAREARNRSELQ